MFVVSAAGAAALVAWGFAGLLPFGDFEARYSDLLTRIAVPERHTGQLVAATTFDFRGFDTLAEEFILFSAAVGVLTLLRVQRDEESQPAELEPNIPVTHSASLGGLATALVAPLVLLGLYIVAHGHLTPGGGFQGGVILMSAFVLVHLAGARLRLGRSRPVEPMEVAEGLGSAGFVLIGVAGLIFASAFLENFLPLGRVGYLWSAGTIPMLNLLVGLAVTGAILAVLAEFLDPRLLARKVAR